MKKFMIGVIMAAVIVLFGCSKDGGSDKKATAIEGPEVVEVAYGGSVNLSTLFSHNGDVGTLRYTLTKDTPEYSSLPETQDAYMRVSVTTVYGLTGSTLTSAAVRVPDVLISDHDNDVGTVVAEDHRYSRSVLQGKLQVELVVGGEVVDSQEYDIIQTDKPALPTPVVTFSTDAALTGGRDADSRTWSMMQQEQNITVFATSDFFTATPIDYDYALSRVAVRAQSGPTYIEGVDGIIKAGATLGNDNYVFGFYNEPRGEDETTDEYAARVRQAAELAEASGDNRVYIRVTESAEPVRVLARDLDLAPDLTPFTFTEGSYSRKGTTTLLMVEMNDGTYKALNDLAVTNKWDVLTVIVGEFDENVEGYTGGEELDHLGYWRTFRLVANTPAGTTTRYTVTIKEHFGEPGWTFDMATEVVAPAARR